MEERKKLGCWGNCDSEAMEENDGEGGWRLLGRKNDGEWKTRVVQLKLWEKKILFLGEGSQFGRYCRILLVCCAFPG